MFDYLPGPFAVLMISPGERHNASPAD